MSDVIQRWDAFLSKTRERLSELMAEAQGVAAHALAETDEFRTHDPGWEAVARRARDLGSKVYQTWSDQARGAMEGASVTGASLEHQRRKGDELRDWIELEIERTKLTIGCESARRNVELEEAERASAPACTGCGAPLAVPIVFITTNFTCPHCRRINEYVPGTRTRMLAAYCMHVLPQAVAWPEYVVMTGAEHAYKRSSSERDKRTWEGAQLAYYRKFLCARVDYLPDEAKSFESELRSAVGAFYKGEVHVPAVTPLTGLDVLRARVKRTLDGSFAIVSRPVTSLTASIYDNARQNAMHYATAATAVGQMKCTSCGAPRMKDDTNVGPCIYCGGTLA